MPLIAQISDLHILSLDGVHWTDFLGKRATGGANLLLNRGGQFPVAVARLLVDDVNAQQPDHVVVTGDLTNLALYAEFVLAERILANLRASGRVVTIVPGNHDYYTEQSQQRDYFSSVFRKELFSAAAYPLVGAFPQLALSEDIAVIALSSAHASPPLLAVGTVGPAQLAAAESLLRRDDVRQRFRLVALHHPPCPAHVKWHNRLTDAPAVAAMLRGAGADLVVHGHLHRFLRQELSGPRGVIPVIGCGSGTYLSPRDPDRRAQYNLYEVAGGELVSIRRRRYNPTLVGFESVD